MNDVSQLTSQLVQFLAPFLPYLLKAGEKAAEEAGKKLGADAWERAKSLWTRLRGKEKVARVAETAAALPDNQALREALREEIARALAEDKALAAEIARAWEEIKAASVTVAAVGERSVAIGGSVSGSTIITGDRNKVER
jgi:hypothetical protein